jgi:glycosyltransferase involved in cell wall biosynthesis
MKVLYLNSGNLFGGIETLLLTFARHRDECSGMTPEFGVCFEGRFSQALRDEGVTVHCFGAARMSKPWQVWRARRRLAASLQASPPDIVVCHGSWSQALLGPAVRAAGIPLVYWTHDRVTNPLPWQERWAKATRPDFVISNSRYTAGGQKGLYDGVPGETIYCALAPPRKRHDEVARAEFRARQNTAPEAAVIVQVSRLDPHKGHRLHLEALGGMRGGPWVCWIVAGPQRPTEELYLAELKQRAKDLGILSQTRFLGWQPEIDIVIDSADIFCQPNSGPEPFGLTYVEALYREKPVVTTAMAGALEVVSDDCGILTPPGDAQALREALTRLVYQIEDRIRLGLAGPARADYLCNPRRRLEEVEVCLRRVIAGS